MKQISKSNTMYFGMIFNCYPNDKFVKFNDLLKDKEDYEDEFLISRYANNKNKIIGSLVDFPLNFLREEQLNRTYFCKEILVPIKNFL